MGAAHAHVGLVTTGAQSVFQTFELGGGGDDMSEESHGVNGSAGALDGSAGADTSSPDGSDDTAYLNTQTPNAQAHAAAAFTSALFSDLGPQFFKVVVAPEGRSLIAEVAGTCTASAVRSFVLSLRDCVFVTSKDGRTSVTVYFANAVRVALIAFAFFWLVASARLAAAYVLVGFGGEQSAVAAATEVAPVAEGGGRGGWRGG